MFSGVLNDPSTNEKDRQKNIKKGSQLKHDDKNPCIKEQERSYRCLDENNYKREVCAGYFENYKKCKEFWGNVRVERRKLGIEPNLPPADERQKIKEEFMQQIRAKQQAQSQR